jgi:hypothetical protein
MWRDKVRVSSRWVGILGCLAVALAGSALAQDAVPATIRVVHVQGPVRCSVDGGNTWKMLKTGEMLRPGVLVQTAKVKSSVDFQLGGLGALKGRAAWDAPDANLVRLYTNSALEIKNVAANATDAGRVQDVNLDLRTGQVLAQVAPGAPDTHYVMTFATGAVGKTPAPSETAPTAFVLNASGDMAVLSGSMLMANAANADTDVHSQPVSSGEKFEAATGKVSKLSPEDPETKLWPPRE